MLLAIAAGILAVAVAAAQTASPTPSPSVDGSPGSLRDAYKEELASQLGISLEELNTALTNTDLALIDQAVEDGRLTEAEAEKLKSHVNDDTNLWPFPPFRKGIEHRLKAGFITEAAEVLGVDQSVITDGLKDGKTLAEIANENGMSAEDFKAALLEQVKSDLDAKVAAGDITQEQADNLYDRLTNNIDEIVNHEPDDFPGPRRDFHFGPRHGNPGGLPFWFGGPGEPEQSEDTDTTTTF
jgi:polyhydroxyalkanoate synthesis regulator phasin